MPSDSLQNICALEPGLKRSHNVPPRHHASWVEPRVSRVAGYDLLHGRDVLDGDVLDGDVPDGDVPDARDVDIAMSIKAMSSTLVCLRAVSLRAVSLRAVSLTARVISRTGES